MIGGTERLFEARRAVPADRQKSIGKARALLLTNARQPLATGNRDLIPARGRAGRGWSYVEANNFQVSLTIACCNEVKTVCTRDQFVPVLTQYERDLWASGNKNELRPIGIYIASVAFAEGLNSTPTLLLRAIITLPKTNLSILVLRKQSNASSGLQTTGSFSLKDVLSSIGIPVSSRKLSINL